MAKMLALCCFEYFFSLTFILLFLCQCVKKPSFDGFLYRKINATSPFVPERTFVQEYHQQNNHNYRHNRQPV
ncbi:MAG: hypothetical protein E2595_13990 [Acinetobacter sp.]|nr:hypothetical protein [Acinetobacter sp.]